MTDLTSGIKALCVQEEIDEVKVVLASSVTTVKLKRTFNQKMLDGSVMRFWRIIGPESHRNYLSDLSIEGLKQWGVIR